MNDQRGVIEKHKSVDLNHHGQETGESSSSLSTGFDQESAAVVRTNGEEGKTDGSKSIEESKGATVSSCKIDVKPVDDDSEGETVCRICHSGSDKSPERFGHTSKTRESSLVELGCGCKDDLGVAHSHCADAWFKLKGNRICEICGEPARNVVGIVVQEPRVVDREERRSYVGGERGGGWWCGGQPCCNFLMALLIVAFVLPWFFRVKIFY